MWNSVTRPRASLSLEPLQNLKVALLDRAAAYVYSPGARRIRIPQPAEEKEQEESAKGNRKEKKREKARTYHFKVAS